MGLVAFLSDNTARPVILPAGGALRRAKALAYHMVNLGSQSWTKSSDLSISSWVTAFAAIHPCPGWSLKRYQLNTQH